MLYRLSYSGRAYKMHHRESAVQPGKTKKPAAQDTLQASRMRPSIPPNATAGCTCCANRSRHCAMASWHSTTPEGLVECQEAIAQCRERLAQQVQPAVAFNGMLGRIRLACKVS